MKGIDLAAHRNKVGKESLGIREEDDIHPSSGIFSAKSQRNIRMAHDVFLLLQNLVHCSCQSIKLLSNHLFRCVSIVKRGDQVIHVFRKRFPVFGMVHYFLLIEICLTLSESTSCDCDATKREQI